MHNFKAHNPKWGMHATTNETPGHLGGVKKRKMNWASILIVLQLREDIG